MPDSSPPKRPTADAVASSPLGGLPTGRTAKGTLEDLPSSRCPRLSKRRPWGLFRTPDCRDVDAVASSPLVETVASVRRRSTPAEYRPVDDVRRYLLEARRPDVAPPSDCR